jgi:hypothetical protein
MPRWCSLRTCAALTIGRAEGSVSSLPLSASEKRADNEPNSEERPYACEHSTEATPYWQWDETTSMPHLMGLRLACSEKGGCV